MSIYLYRDQGAQSIGEPWWDIFAGQLFVILSWTFDTWLTLSWTMNLKSSLWSASMVSRCQWLNDLMKLMVTCLAWGSLRIPCLAEGEARPQGLKVESFHSLRARWWLHRQHRCCHVMPSERCCCLQKQRRCLRQILWNLWKATWLNEEFR